MAICFFWQGTEIIYFTLPTPKNIWFKKLILWQFERVMFPNMRQLYKEIIPNMVSKSIESHVIPTFIEATIITITFDFRMSWEGFDMFVLVVNYISKKWVPYQITIGIFKVHKHQELPWFCHWKIYLPTLTCVTRSYTCINNEGTNLNSHKCLNKHYVMCYINVATTIC
jgi:hypothetical protein